MAVLPSDDTATELPSSAFPTSPVPSSFPPCWTNCALAEPASAQASVNRTQLRAIIALRPVDDVCSWGSPLVRASSPWTRAPAST